MRSSLRSVHNCRSCKLESLSNVPTYMRINVPKIASLGRFHAFKSSGNTFFGTLSVRLSLQEIHFWDTFRALKSSGNTFIRTRS